MRHSKWSAALRRWRHNVPTLVLCVVVLLLASVIALGRLTHNDLVMKATTHQPERFTELYFADPTNLPTKAMPNQELQVSFSIHNVEYRPMTYTYCVHISGGDTACPTYQISLQQNETQTITAALVVPAGTGRTEVSVDLLNKHQSIHFWLERQSL